jgi:hypothetical protein
MTSVQVPLHIMAPEGQEQLPPEQLSAPVQTLPQPPQLAGSVLVFTQAVPHLVVPETQPAHIPWAHVCWAAQAWPQVPQLAPSFMRLAQPESQQLSPMPQIWPMQVQAPFWHCSGAGQETPQAPQLALSPRTSTQEPATGSQHRLGAGQSMLPQGQLPVVEQTPPAQHSPPSAQAAFLPHMQVPPEQTSPGLQA